MLVKALPYCAMAIVRLTADAVEQFKALPRVIRERVQKILARLEKWPEVSGVKPLSGGFVRLVSAPNRRFPRPLSSGRRAGHR